MPALNNVVQKRNQDFGGSGESTNAKLNSESTVLRERQTSVEVLKEQKYGLQKRVQVLEKLRTKVVSLEADGNVKIGIYSHSESFRLIMVVTTYIYLYSDSRILLRYPITVTQSLSESCVWYMHVFWKITVPQPRYYDNEK